MISCMVCPSGEIPDTGTGTCGKCGSVYRRGVLISEGRVKKAVPIRQRRAGMEDPDPIDFETLPFQHYENANSRDEAIAQMWAALDAKPGRRRKPAAEAFEILSSHLDTTRERSTAGVWILTLRRRAS